jgi:uncharacterized membrane protein YbhN (UPF0104 family)
MYKKAKLILGPLIVIATIALFGWYLATHPAVLDQLQATKPSTVAILIVLYAGVQIVLAFILTASLMMYGKHMGTQENFLLNAYSSLVNFFGPGQSGPGFRTLYLKVKHGIGIKQYIFATLIYYAFYAVFSGIVLLAFAQPWWVTAGAAIALATGSYGVIRYFIRKNGAQQLNQTSIAKAISIIGITTALQIGIMSAIYYVELHSLDPSVTFGQAAAYSGAANFAIFVALTPGAIGIREAFLVATQKMHGISQDLIIAANVLDRAVYLVFLGILLVFVLALHANKKLAVKKIQQDSR